jgi:hypothetical protein
MALAFAAGAATVLVAALAGASVRGTSPTGVWDAVVWFRLRATDVIGSSASPATSQRLGHLALAYLCSGAAVVLVVTAVTVLRQAVRRDDTGAPSAVSEPLSGLLAWPALAMATWELVAVALGGSYWLHYLTGTVPGLAVLLAVVRPRPPARRLLGLAVGYTVVASAAVSVYVHAAGPASTPPDAEVERYLHGHAATTDGVVVAFGHPDIVAGSRLHSPYEYLWSLPVRVRDPRLAELEDVMAGPAAPRWVVVAGDSLASWGIRADDTERYLQQHYTEQVTYGDWHVWERAAGRQP